jgi:hypothetical protein
VNSESHRSYVQTRGGGEAWGERGLRRRRGRGVGIRCSRRPLLLRYGIDDLKGWIDIDACMNIGSF